ncbi:hypothetical protein HD554DRAFT_2175858 [Boletus coccyginus]|nr:hypothetical protein HD554DRAFT_2175858 [Boletus coccyginus]
MAYAAHPSDLAHAHDIPLSDIEYHQFPIQDRSLFPGSGEFMFAILDVLMDNERRGRVSAVHSYAKSGEGASRIIAVLWKMIEKSRAAQT